MPQHLMFNRTMTEGAEEKTQQMSKMPAVRFGFSPKEERAKDKKTVTKPTAGELLSHITENSVAPETFAPMSAQDRDNLKLWSNMTGISIDFLSRNDNLQKVQYQANKLALNNPVKQSEQLGLTPADFAGNSKLLNRNDNVQTVQRPINWLTLTQNEREDLREREKNAAEVAHIEWKGDSTDNHLRNSETDPVKMRAQLGLTPADFVGNSNLPSIVVTGYGAQNPFKYGTWEYWVVEWAAKTDSWEEAFADARNEKQINRGLGGKYNDWIDDQKTAAEHYLLARSIQDSRPNGIRDKSFSYIFTALGFAAPIAYAGFKEAVPRPRSKASKTQIDAGLSGWRDGLFIENKPYINMQPGRNKIKK